VRDILPTPCCSWIMYCSRRTWRGLQMGRGCDARRQTRRRQLFLPPHYQHMRTASCIALAELEWFETVFRPRVEKLLLLNHSPKTNTNSLTRALGVPNMMRKRSPRGARGRNENGAGRVNVDCVRKRIGTAAPRAVAHATAQSSIPMQCARHCAAQLRTDWTG